MDLQHEIEQLKPWFHNIHLPDGSQTAPEHFLGDFPSFKWELIKKYIPEDLSRWTALDIGCNAGFYSLEMAKRGAKVLGIDLDLHYLKQAQLIMKFFNFQDKVKLKNQQVYDLARDDKKYDLVWFMGVFYHLRYPLLALDIIAQKTKKLLVFQSLTMPGDEHPHEISHDYKINDRNEMLKSSWPKMAFIEQKLNNDPTNWWAPNPAAVEAMLRSSGFKIIARPGQEIYICKPDPDNPPVAATWNRSEYLSAIGKDWKDSLKIKTGVHN